jgi:HK97 gp10 family phage protein
LTDSFTIEIKGKEEFEKTLRNLIKALPVEQVEPVLLDGAKVILQAGKPKTPRGPTGNLRGAWVAKLLKSVGNWPRSAMVAINRKKAPHAHLVEFGHINWRGGIRKKGEGHQIGGKKGTLVYTPAHPFFRPAVDANIGRVYNQIKDALLYLIISAAREK